MSSAAFNKKRRKQSIKKTLRTNRHDATGEFIEFRNKFKTNKKSKPNGKRIQRSLDKNSHAKQRIEYTQKAANPQQNYHPDLMIVKNEIKYVHRSL